MGAPGSQKQEHAEFLVQKLTEDSKGKFKCINANELLKAEVKKGSEIGKRINECDQEHCYGKFISFAYNDHYYS